MSKIPILEIDGFFSNFALYSKGSKFSITRVDILIFCNNTTSWNKCYKFVLKNDSFFIKFLAKVLLKKLK